MKRFLKLGIVVGFAMTFAFMGCKHNVANPESTPEQTQGENSGQTQGQTTGEIQYTELPEDTTGTAGTTGRYVLFGEWPQTIKDVNVDLTPESKDVGMFKYWKGNDGCWYVNIRENACSSGYTYTNGTSVGQYGVDEGTGSYRSKYFKVEPIKWRVLTDDYNGKKLLLAEDILINFMYFDNDTQIRNDSIYPSNYKESRIRAYLNGLSYNVATQTVNYEFVGKGFLQTAFTEAERSAIVDTTLDNSARSTNPDSIPLLWNNGTNSYACDNTTDKIFLLSEQEVTKNMYDFAAYNQEGALSARIRLPTDFAKASGASQDMTPGYGSWWWLRSPDTFSPNNVSNSYLVHIVRGYGAADYIALPSEASYGVCPALCIN